MMPGFPGRQGGFPGGPGGFPGGPGGFPGGPGGFPGGPGGFPGGPGGFPGGPGGFPGGPGGFPGGPGGFPGGPGPGPGGQQPPTSAPPSHIPHKPLKAPGALCRRSRRHLPLLIQIHVYMAKQRTTILVLPCVRWTHLNCWIPLDGILLDVLWY